MAEQVTNYKCLSCTGPLKFVGESGQLECEYCGTKYDVSTIEQVYADKEESAASAGTEPKWDVSASGVSWSEEEAAHLRGYTCPSCAAEIICDDTTAATSCPYCGNPTTVPGQFSGQLKPNYIIPFKLDKPAAIAALKKYYKGKKFLPNSFAGDNHVSEIKGVYVPFWLYDGETDASMRFHATTVSSHTSGNYRVTTTSHYRVTRDGSVAFEKVPVDGSSKMPDTHMDAVEPFDYNDLKPFSSAYFPGFLADKYDQDAEECSTRANERIIASTEKAFIGTTKGYATITREYSNINLKKGNVSYAMLPVWLLSTKWNGQNFLFAMNGQTGKLIGDLPVDRGKYWGWFFKLYLPIAAVLAAILFLGGMIL